MQKAAELRVRAADVLLHALGALLLLTSAPLWASSGASVATADRSLTVRVEGGRIAGTQEKDVIAFKGIPYAAPPVGVLRWRAPQPVAAWSGVRSAAHYGADCMQVPFPDDDAPLRGSPAEDCLYLNVWKPAAPAAAKLPVMVWIHGGGFVNGGTSPAVYEGSAFARDGIVLVSFNYRLGHFGFFAHPALTAEQKGSPLGNYAFMDQIAALKWVQRNINRFGGDPGNVTIFGESAGGVSVHVLLSSPLAAHLFHKAIIESGGGRAGLLDPRPLAQAEERGVALARSHGIEGQGREALARLRELPAATLLGRLNMATMKTDPTYVGGPILDGQLDLGVPVNLYAAGQASQVPTPVPPPVQIIVGANSADLDVLKAHTLEELYALFGPDAVEARSLYPGGDAPAAAVIAAAGGDQAMLEPARKVAQLLSARGQRVYEFRFSYVAQSLRNTTSGARHASEIPYVFDTVAARYGQNTSAADEEVARAMHAGWVAFARTGRPDAPGLPAWPAYDDAKDPLMNYTQAGPHAGPDPWKARLDLAQRVNERKGAER